MKTTMWTMKSLIGMAACLVLCGGMAEAADYTWYVDQNVVGGDGSGSSWENATTTIQGAVNAAGSWLATNWDGTRDNMDGGDSIHIIVREGTYVESIAPGSNGDGSKRLLMGSNTGSAPLYIESEFWDTTGKTSTIVQAPTDAGDIFYMRSYGSEFGNWTVRGFTLRHDLDGATANYRNGLLDSAGSGTVENNIIEVVNTTGSDLRWYGIGSAADLVITDNVIRKLGSGVNSPIGLQFGSNNEIYNNLITVSNQNTTGNQASVMNATGNADNNEIYQNIVMGSPTYGADRVLAFPGYWVAGDSDNNEVYANIFAYANRMLDMGHVEKNTNDSNAFYNNTFYSGQYIHCYGTKDAFFNNLMAGKFPWGNGIFHDAADHPGATHNDVNDGTNYYRAPSTIFETTTLPAGWEDKLPSELAASGWLRPVKGSTLPGKSSVEAHKAAVTDVYGANYGAPQIGAVATKQP